MATTTRPLLIRKQLRVRGIVQGVGFRPFVYNLARDLGLSGYVLNSSAGVTVEIEGTDEGMQKFLDALQHRPPPLALIKEVSVADLEPLGDADFVIRQSHSEAGEFVLVSPDMATCDDCWHDFGDHKEPPLWISFYQLHQLRTALHHHSRHSLRSPDDDYVVVSHVRTLPGGIRGPGEPPLSRSAECLSSVRSGSGDRGIRIGISARC